MVSKNGVAFVELGEPIKCVPPNGKIDSIKVEVATGTTLVYGKEVGEVVPLVSEGVSHKETYKTIDASPKTNVVSVVRADHFDDETEDSIDESTPDVAILLKVVSKESPNCPDVG